MHEQHDILPSDDELDTLFLKKYGRPSETGWAPRRRLGHRYFLPADVYEATVAKHVGPGCSWIDVGGGRSIFPDAPGVARSLVEKCWLVVGVDPDDSIHENELVHVRVQSPIEQHRSKHVFDVATLRMVAEHVADTEPVVESLRRLVRPGGLAIVYTVNRWSPITLVSRLTPFWLHHKVKALFWRSEERDTFPAHYRMNSRSTLRQLFEQRGFRERAFAYLDDLSMFGRFKRLNVFEMALWSVLKKLGVRYPENCLLGIYERT